MRKLKTSDAPALMRVLAEAGIRTEVRAIVERAQAAGGGVKAEDLGWELILMALERLSRKNAEEALYAFLAGPLEVMPEEVADMDLAALMEALEAWGRNCFDREAARRFFGYVSRLMTASSTT